jgi:serine/threonine protein kinase/WD40 repeat protein
MTAPEDRSADGKRQGEAIGSTDAQTRARRAAELPDGSFRSQGNPSSSPSLAVSVLVEFKRRRQAGERITARDFVAQRKIVDPELVVDLAFIEFLDEDREAMDGAEERLCGEFPEHAAELRRQIYFHRALVDQGDQFAQPVDDSLALDRSESRLAFDGDLGPTPDIPGLSMVKPIGRGGMGVVYLAQQPSLNRQVAVKLLLGGAFATKELRARFRAEAQMAASLRHPNIVQIFDVGESRGQPYLIMEYVESGTLDDFMAKRLPTVQEAAATIMTLARALHETHQLGIFHRDLKPGNILLSRNFTPDGRASQNEAASLADFTPKITDFGLAKFQHAEQVHSGPALTLAGDVLGTPSYMAPEQANGTVAGPRTDVYSLGAILYQMLAGKPPHQAATPWETLQQLMRDDPPELPRSLPRNLRTICHKCLARPPHDRYSSMSALAEDLQRYLEGRPIQARRISPLEKAISWCLRNRMVTALTTIVVLALATLLGVSLWSRSQLKDLLYDMAESRKNESAARAEAVDHLWDSLISEARAQQTSGRIGQRILSVGALKKAIDLLPEVGRTPDRLEAIRDTAIASIALSDMRKLGSWQGPSLLPCISVTADRRHHRLAQLCEGKITVSEDLGTKIIHKLSEPGALQLALSSNGRWLAACGESCKLFDLSFDQPKLVKQFSSGGSWGFSLDDSRLVGSTTEGLLIFNLPEDLIERQIPGIRSESPLAFAEDNQKLALKSDNQILILNFVTGEQLAELPAGTAQLENVSMAWHPNSRFLAAGIYDNDKIFIFDTLNQNKFRTISQGGLSISMAFDQTGDHLLFCSEWDQTLKVFDVESESPILSLAGNTLTRFVSNEAGVKVVLRTETQDLSVWEFTPQKVLKNLLTESPRSAVRQAVDVSPQGDWLVVGAQDGFEIVALGTKQSSAKLAVGSPQVAPRFDRAGRLAGLFGNQLVRWEIKDQTLCAPSILSQSTDFWPIQIDYTGEWILASNTWEVRVESLSEPKKVIPLGSHDDVRGCDFSHDGRWVATGGWNGSDTKVWSMTDGTLVATLPTGTFSLPQFSPDGRWLVTSPNGGVVWDTSNWTEALKLNSLATASSGLVFAFSADSRWLANSRPNGELQLWDLEKRCSLGILKDPYQFRIQSIEFSPDQRELFLIRRDKAGGVVSVWDLTLLKAELKKFKVDWPFEIPPVDQSTQQSPRSDQRLVVEENAILNGLLGAKAAEDGAEALDRGEWQRGLQLLRRAAELGPADPRILNNLAWNLLVCPAEFRDPPAALKLAEQAVNRDENLIYVNTLGTAQYRNGLFKQAVETLKISLGDGTADTATFDYFILSGCYASLGEREQAQQMLENGIAAYERIRTRAEVSWHAELQMFRQEAETAINRLKQ